MSENTKNIQSFRCENCGGTVKWNIKRKRLECASCQTPFELPDSKEPVLEHDYNDYDETAAASVSFPEQEIITCSTCGAQIAFDAGRTATVCPMCGSSQVMASKQEAGVPPDGIVPFAIDKADGQELFRKWVTSRWFAPNRLKQSYQQGKLDGIYLPFWTFDMEAEADYVGEGGTEYQEEDDDGDSYTSVRWRKVRGHVLEEYDDLPICAASEKYHKSINDILPFSTEEGSVPYNSAYLSGMAAERYAITAEQALETAKETIESDLKSKAAEDIKVNKGFDQANVKKLEDLELYNIAYKHILVPVWVSAFSYNGKQYTYLINGETGEVSGERPYSIPKIIAAVAAAIAVALLLFTLLTGCSAAPDSGTADNAEAASVAYETELYQDTPAENTAAESSFIF